MADNGSSMTVAGCRHSTLDASNLLLKMKRQGNVATGGELSAEEEEGDGSWQGCGEDKTRQDLLSFRTQKQFIRETFRRRRRTFTNVMSVGPMACD